MQKSILLLASLIFFVVLYLVIFIPRVGATPASTILVNDLGDNAIASDGVCALREAINNANAVGDATGGDCAAGSGADTITFDVSGIITLTSSLPPISNTLTIDGSGQVITVSGNYSVQVISVNSGANVTVNSLSIAKGLCSGCDGGGIYNNGSLTVTNSIFSSNIALPTSFTGGGAIFNGGSLIVTDSTFFGNWADTGGGILNTGVMSVTNSTFSINTGAGYGGGAIYNNFNGVLIVTNSTFSNNSVHFYGGAIYTLGYKLTVSNSTFSGNSASYGGGALFSSQGISHMNNTIVANSTFSACYGILADSHNIADDNTCGGATVKSSAQINLGPPVDNGGGTPTMALLPGSAALDTADDSVCPSTDQRGVKRPQGAHCDVGAYEAFVVYFLPLLMR